MFVDPKGYEKPNVETENDPNFDSGDAITGKALESDTSSLLVVWKSCLTPELLMMTGCTTTYFSQHVQSWERYVILL